MNEALAILGWIAGWLLFARFRRCPSGSPSPRPPLSIIVPARNEAHNLPRLLDSLRSQLTPQDEVIVVDDHSEDETASVASQRGARVVTAEPLPEGWYGKPWACSQGARAAKGAVLIFLDADAWLEADGLNRMIAALGDRAAISIQPHHVTSRWSESFSFIFNLLVIAGLGRFLPGKPPHNAGHFSACLVFHSKPYHALGGHEGVRRAILDGPGFAKLLAARHLPSDAWSGEGVVSFRMYPGSFNELCEGWAKGFASGAGGTPAFAMIAILLWLSGAAVSARIAMASPWGIALYIGYALQFIVLGRRTGKFQPWAPILFPLPLCFFFGLFLISFIQTRIRGRVSWKGRALPIA